MQYKIYILTIWNRGTKTWRERFLTDRERQARKEILIKDMYAVKESEETIERIEPPKKEIKSYVYENNSILEIKNV